jgi:hypothetical protein
MSPSAFVEAALEEAMISKSVSSATWRQCRRAAISLAMISAAVSGCANYPVAKGVFVGSVSPASVRTSDGGTHTAYVITIEQGPVFHSKAVGSGRSALFTSAGKKAFLARDSRGEVFHVNPDQLGRPLKITGVMMPSGMARFGGNEARATDSQMQTDYALRVCHIEVE